MGWPDNSPETRQRRRRPRLVLAAEPLAVDVERAADLLGVSPRAIQAFIADGALPIVKLPSTRSDGETSRRVLVSIDDLRAFIAKHREVAR